MALGEDVHLRHGQGVRASVALSRLAYAVLLLAVVVGVMWFVGGLGG
jgi:hypothetical protein